MFKKKRDYEYYSSYGTSSRSRLKVGRVALVGAVGVVLVIGIVVVFLQLQPDFRPHAARVPIQ